MIKRVINVTRIFPETLIFSFLGINRDESFHNGGKSRFRGGGGGGERLNSPRVTFRGQKSKRTV